ncbi:type II secretion system F family protein [Silvibacterium sp.]|uniref:type II secretion system F family protein n=1 Tax=Silvibacterium sp. TaxID=1964179 RepID=UPI0039E2DE98
MQILFVVALGVMLFCIVAILVIPFMLRGNRESRRVIEALGEKHAEPSISDKVDRLQAGVLRVAQDIRTRLGLSISTRSIDRLAAAGYQGANAPDLYFAAECLVPLAGAFIGSFIPKSTLFWVFILVALGYLLPGIWLTERARRRRDRIGKSLPDVIDLLVICVEAGLGLDQALLRVNKEIAAGHPELQKELARVHLEQRAGRPRMETWQNLADRLKVREVSIFVSMLTQADRFGTPISKTLSTFAEDLRTRRRQRVEEMAQKTKVKIIVPLVFCIFPCLFIVLLGPAILQIVTSLKGFGR